MDIESQNERLTQTLRELSESVPEVIASSIVTADGLPIVSNLPRDADESQIAAMSATMVALGGKTVEELGKKGGLEQVHVHGTGGYLFTLAAGDKAVLIVSTTDAVKLGFIFYELQRSCKKVAEILAS